LGFELINNTSPDLLFLDINMPEKRWFCLLEMLDNVPITVLQLP
jgi:two-component system LytT family response regulator